MRKRELSRRLVETERAKADLIEAIRLTQEYIQLPAVEGWSWYDALRRNAPDVLMYLEQDYRRRMDLRAPSPPVGES